MSFVSQKTADWRDPVEVMAPFADKPFALLMLSNGSPGARWSYLSLLADDSEKLWPDDADTSFASLAEWLTRNDRAAPLTQAPPPFQGGIVALAAYEYADRLEQLDLLRDPDWPDLCLIEVGAVLAFDHEQKRVLAVGRGMAPSAAKRAVSVALSWLTGTAAKLPSSISLADEFTCETDAAVYEAAVTDVIGRIAAGEIFQANIARTWTGTLRPEATPFDVFRRLTAQSPAPYSAYLRLPGLALVSHSPEQFVAIAADGKTVTSRPIKGTRPRGETPEADAEQIAALLASDKERAENLMIVDLVRNDLARVCIAGSVKTPELFAVQTFPAVHHLVSTITGTMIDGLGPADLLAATFPPGSITGAPKIQAMKVIAGHEPPRGPWCGTLAWVGYNGAMDSSVLIRTAAFVQDAEGWRFRATAGAGIVADSNPVAEREETEVKIAGLRRALVEPR